MRDLGQRLFLEIKVIIGNLARLLSYESKFANEK